MYGNLVLWTAITTAHCSHYISPYPPSHPLLSPSTPLLFLLLLLWCSIHRSFSLPILPCMPGKELLSSPGRSSRLGAFITMLWPERSTSKRGMPRVWGSSGIDYTRLLIIFIIIDYIDCWLLIDVMAGCIIILYYVVVYGYTNRIVWLPAFRKLYIYYTLYCNNNMMYYWISHILLAIPTFSCSSVYIII